MEGLEAKNKDLLEYLEKAENGVIRTAYKLGNEIGRVLDEAVKKANKRAGNDEGEEEKVRDLVVCNSLSFFLIAAYYGALKDRMNRIPERVEAGIKKYYQDTMRAAGHKNELEKSKYIEGEDRDEGDMVDGKYKSDTKHEAFW